MTTAFYIALAAIAGLSSAIPMRRFTKTTPDTFYPTILPVAPRHWDTLESSSEGYQSENDYPVFEPEVESIDPPLCPGRRCPYKEPKVEKRCPGPRCPAKPVEDYATYDYEGGIPPKKKSGVPCTGKKCPAAIDRDINQMKDAIEHVFEDAGVKVSGIIGETMKKMMRQY